MDDIVETEMLSVKQVAQMYGKAPNTIWVWTRNNKIPQPTYIGGSTLWSRRQSQIYRSGRYGRDGRAFSDLYLNRRRKPCCIHTRQFHNQFEIGGR